MEEPVAKILIIRLSSIGDIVLTTPVIRRLKEQLPGGAEIHFLTKKKFAPLLEANPYLTKVHVMEKTIQEPLDELQQIGFDYVIDLHRNFRSAIVKRRLKCLSFSFDKLNFKKWLWVNLGINRMPNKHIVDRYLDTIRGFQTTDDGKGLDYFIPAESVPSRSILPAGFPEKYIAIAIGGAHIGKKMSKEKMASICEKIHFPIVLIGGKEDAEDAEFIVDRIKGTSFNAAGKFTLHQSADCIKNATLVIAGDTGMMHIASAFQKKIISLWGCTVPGLGMYPYRPHPDSVMVEPKGRDKRPCSKLGNKCKYGEGSRCIEQIVNEEIVGVVERLMQDSRR
jgi:ADP-heptose:LPS heptosyltransferase